MFDKKIEKLREELRKEMLELADSREAKLKKEIDYLRDIVRVLNFKLRANGAKYIVRVSPSRGFEMPCVYVEHVFRDKLYVVRRYVPLCRVLSAKVVGNYIEIYDDGNLVEVLTQLDDSFVNVELEMYKNSKKYDEIYNQPCQEAAKENNDDQSKDI